MSSLRRRISMCMMLFFWTDNGYRDHRMFYLTFLSIGTNSSCDTDLSLCLARRASKIILRVFMFTDWIGAKEMGTLGRKTILFGMKLFFNKPLFIRSWFSPIIKRMRTCLESRGHAFSCQRIPTQR